MWTASSTQSVTRGGLKGPFLGAVFNVPSTMSILEAASPLLCMGSGGPVRQTPTQGFIQQLLFTGSTLESEGFPSVIKIHFMMVMHQLPTVPENLFPRPSITSAGNFA